MSEPIFYTETPLDDFRVAEMIEQLNSMSEGNRRLIYEYLADHFRPPPTNIRRRPIQMPDWITCQACAGKKKHFWQHCDTCNDTGKVWDI